jgi:hypothetical protein
MTVTTNRPEVEPPLPPPRGGVPVRRTCFSGDGRMTSRRWAPGGDTRYRERLRRAHAAGRQVPDPWIIAEQTGREDTLPDGWDAWPTMDPMEVARKLDAERVNADPYAHPSHWQDWLTFTERRQAERAQARAAAADRPSAHRTRSEQEAARQMARPQRHAKGTAYPDPDQPETTVRVQVVDLADRERLIVRKIDDPADTGQFLIYDDQFSPDPPARNLDDIAQDSGESSPMGGSRE